MVAAFTGQRCDFEPGQDELVQNGLADVASSLGM